MKIAILTQPLANNYGGLLQNYALQTVLKSAGHEVETIDHGNRAWYWEFFDKLRAWLKYLLGGLKVELKPKYKPTAAELAVIRQHTNSFINQHINRTPVMHTYGDFRRCAIKNRYEAYVVGSDQCWRPSYNNFILAMFLNFVENESNIKRVAYAASFGSDRWEIREFLTPTCARLAKLFNMVTVREKSGVQLCKDYLGVDSYHVLDPTMFLDRDDYENLVNEENEPVSEGDLFHYILDPNSDKMGLINHIAQINQLKPFTVMPKCQAENRTKEDIKYHIEDCVFPSVTRWLRGFMDAKMVVVDSFHGAVFSIIFNKPFWVISNGRRGNARFESLLSLYELQDRYIENAKKQDYNWNLPIDWKKVNEIREREKKKSLILLNRGLE